MAPERYSSTFYEDQKTGSSESAKVIVPLVLKLVKARSVIDVGCGIGTWLAVFKKEGVKETAGVDGPWVKPEQLLIPAADFRSVDLRKPLSLSKKFDLAVSLEVAEHLPRESADTFVESLVRASDIVLFSAAIPFQGGTDHLNEQWQHYWAQKFEKHGYEAVDCIRSRVWTDARVAFFYAQNMLLFVKKSKLKQNKLLQREHALTKREQLSIVHPHRYTLIAQERKKMFNALPGPVRSLLSFFYRRRITS